MKFKAVKPENLKKMEKGMYDEASEKGLPFDIWLEDYITTPEGGGFEKTVYHGMTNYDKAAYQNQLIKEGTNAQDLPVDALKLALAVQGIRAFGSNTDNVSKFYENSQSLILFPVYVTNQIYGASLRAGRVQDLIANTTTITGLDFRKIYLADTEPDRQMGITARGAEAPSKHYKVRKETVYLTKYMISLLFDYEALYDTPLNLYNTVLMKIGDQFAIDETDDLIYALINGDGNTNGLESAQTVTTVTSTAIEKLDIIGLKSALPLPYELDVFVGKKAYMRKYWDALSDMQNPAQQWGMTGMSLPRGYDWDRTIVTADRFFGVDSKRAVGLVTNDTAIMTETDKIINRQVVETVLSKRSKFHIIEQDAIGCLDIEH